MWQVRILPGPPFFDQNQFLFSNPLQLLGFAIMAAWAVTIRKNTGWHRRLMYCAFAMLTGPGFVTKDNAAEVAKLAEAGTR